jgi:hypothetical protein
MKKIYKNTNTSWEAMKARCSNPNNNRYKNYGGRGIKVCKRWMKFENFLKDMGLRPDGLSLDRINNNKNYIPSNCKWSTQKEQANNRKTNHNIKINGVTKNIKQWSELSGIKQTTILARLKYGYSNKEAVFKPLNKAKKFRMGNKYKTLQEWSKIYNISYKLIFSRFKYSNLSLKESIFKPIRKGR